MKSERRTEADTDAASLNTPSDLGGNGRAEVTAEINKLVADAFVLYLKTKNFHWHMSGPHFRDYHLMLDEQSSQIFAIIDPLAERVRKLGFRTLHSISEVRKQSRIPENDRDLVPPIEMLRELMVDNKALVKSMRDAHEICDSHKDVASASLFEVYIDEAERRIWFLFEAAQSQDDTGH